MATSDGIGSVVPSTSLYATVAAASPIGLDGLVILGMLSGLPEELTRSWRILRGDATKAAVLVGADPVARGVALLAEGVLGVLYPDAAAI